MEGSRSAIADQDCDGTAPAVSILMPARNVAKYIDAAVSSMIGQTFGDFELIICDDCSCDETPAKIAGWAKRDPRIRAYYSDRYLGPSKVANWTVELARAPLIVRMDADDLSHPDRIRRQYEIMQQRPDIALLGAMFDGIDRDTQRVYGRDRSIMLRSEFIIPAGHATAMFRRKAIQKIGGYREACDFWEDFDMIYRIAAVGKVCFSTDVLFHYRHSRRHARVNAEAGRIERALELRERCARQFARSGEYESILAQPEPRHSERVSPQVFQSIAVLHTLAGNRHLLVRRFLKRAKLGPSPKAARAFGMLLLTRIAPKFVRSVQARRRVTRDRSAEIELAGKELVEWYWSKNHPARTANTARAIAGDATSRHAERTRAHQNRPVYTTSL